MELIDTYPELTHVVDQGFTFSVQISILTICRTFGRSRKKSQILRTNSRKKWLISREFFRPVLLENDW